MFQPSETASETSSMSSSMAQMRHYLLNLGRLLVALCCVFCFYFLVVCVFTGHSFVMFHESSHLKPTSAKLVSSDSLKYESIDQPDTLVDAILDSSEDRVKPKLARLLNARQPGRRSKFQMSPNEKTDVDNAYADCAYHLAFTLLEQNNNEHRFASKLMKKFTNTLTSILLNINSTNLDQGSLCIHLITDDAIRYYIRDVISQVHENLIRESSQMSSEHHRRHQHLHFGSEEPHRPLTRYFFIDSASIEARLDYLLPTLRTFFTHKPNSYYSNALFFYSMVLHEVIPSSMADRLLLLDVDVQLDGNILELYEEFGRFQSDEVIGLAYEQQPVYRHILHEYRRTHENTTAGSPPPNGFPGFNSGVVLLHLRKMRQSKVYNSLLNANVIKSLCDKYHFRGHLGDQDFYTLAALDRRDLFHTLSCGWNRQLCQWWRFHGYGQVFDDYHRCGASVALYHGNCNSALPSLPHLADYRRR